MERGNSRTLAAVTDGTGLVRQLAAAAGAGVGQSEGVPDLDPEAEDRQLGEAYDAPADWVARSGWGGRSSGGRGRGWRMGRTSASMGSSMGGDADGDGDGAWAGGGGGDAACGGGEGAGGESRVGSARTSHSLTMKPILKKKKGFGCH